jgi:steroid 5-alpha reductase family enzyme
VSRTRGSLLGLVAVAALGTVVAWAGSQGGATSGGVAVFALCALVSFGVNTVVFVHAYARQTEQFFDLTGSLTYLTLVTIALVLGVGDARAVLLAALIAVWALRLGSFLFLRIRRDGGDGRFDRIKPSLSRFLLTWMIQALWVLLTAGAALAAMTAPESTDLGPFAAVGVALWVAGFAIEVVADRQKSAFRAEPANRGQFITVGLWSWSRHPNYFGEILLWFGIAVISAPTLEGARLLTLVSPIFVLVLLTRVSGVPLLEARGKRRWGDQPEYQAYLEQTPTLIPRPPTRGLPS